MWEVKKISWFSIHGKWNPTYHLAAAKHVKLWSLNANLSFFEEPHQLTEFSK